MTGLYNNKNEKTGQKNKRQFITFSTIRNTACHS